jgi:hypothetical protein
LKRSDRYAGTTIINSLTNDLQHQVEFNLFQPPVGGKSLGMQISGSDGQRANAPGPRVEILHPDSNVKLARLLQSLKQDFEIVVIDEGMQIDVRDEQYEKADSPRIAI